MPPIIRENKDKKCFIIMPISTPDNWLLKYPNDTEHFKHVLEHLLIPSLEKADLEPIPPNTKGSDVIHGNIIKNIESADLVLCDMSILNPNVFLELGIRIAINKPICLIKDDITNNIPFDTAIINCHTYLSALTPWTLEKEIDDLSNHIKESFDRSKGSNSLWKYFSLSTPAEPVEAKQGVEARIDYLTRQIEALREQLSISSKVSSIEVSSPSIQDPMIDRIRGILSSSGSSLERYMVNGSILNIIISKKINKKDIDELYNLIREFGFEKLNIEVHKYWGNF